MKNLLGKVIALTRKVYINNKPDETFITSNFFAGKGDSFSRISFKWYLDPCIKTIANDILTIAAAKDSRFLGIDEISFYKAVEQALKENSLNTSLFEINSLISRNVSTLFEAKKNSIDVNVFGKRLWDVIEAEALASIKDWLLIYPLENLEIEQSFALPTDGLTLLKHDDVATWSTFNTKYANTGDWNIITGKYNDYIQDITVPLVRQDKLSWIIVEDKGTELGIKRSAVNKIRTFLSVVLSMNTRRRELLICSSKEGMGYACQFSGISNVGSGSVFSYVGILLPSIIEPINISTQVIQTVNEWYSLREQASQEILQKAVVASHFINYGINAEEDLDRFIHFFIALDALFGRRAQVEKGIKFGISETFSGDKSWINRADKLFDLRNELLHGSSSAISDWKSLESYERTFHTNPLEDVMEAAMSAFSRYFSLPIYENKKLGRFQKTWKWIKECPLVKKSD